MGRLSELPVDKPASMWHVIFNVTKQQSRGFQMMKKDGFSFSIAMSDLCQA